MNVRIVKYCNKILRATASGQALVWFALVIALVMLPVTALVIDMGLMTNHRFQMQRAADAAALAAANAALNAPASERTSAYDYEQYIIGQVDKYATLNGQSQHFSLTGSLDPSVTNNFPVMNVVISQEHFFIFGGMSFAGVAALPPSVTITVSATVSANSNSLGSSLNIPVSLY